MGRRTHDPDPGTPHEFRQVDDPGMAAFASGGSQISQGFGSVTQIVTTDNFLRKARCGVPGCDRERTDPIHQRDED